MTIKRDLLEKLLESYETVYEMEYVFHYDQFAHSQREAELWGKIELIRHILNDDQYKELNIEGLMD